jgi:hypothetical protein
MRVSASQTELSSALLRPGLMYAPGMRTWRRRSRWFAATGWLALGALLLCCGGAGGGEASGGAGGHRTPDASSAGAPANAGGSAAGVDGAGAGAGGASGDASAGTSAEDAGAAAAGGANVQDGGSGGTSGDEATSGLPGASCEGVSCAPLECGPNRPEYVVPNECCPRCGADCSRVTCPELRCGPSVVPYKPKSACCPICGPDCRNVTCASTECPQGTTLVPPEPGQCCGTCVDADGPICEPEAYDGFREQQIAELDALTCTDTIECASFHVISRCKLECGTPSTSATAATIGRALLALSELRCRGCDRDLTEECVPRAWKPECLNGRCALVSSR